MQPIQVGYSYGKSRVGTSEQAAKATYAFLVLFFEEFPQYAQKYFHISGESYGKFVKLPPLPTVLDYLFRIWVSAHLQLATTFLHSEEKLSSTNKAQHHPTSNWIPS